MDWKEIDENTILNYDDAHTGNMARYERIMSRRLRDSIISFTATFNDQANALKDSINNFNKSSTELSSRLCWLNIMLVILTIVLVIFGVPAFVWQLKHW